MLLLAPLASAAPVDLPLDRLSTGHLVVPVQIAGKPHRFLLDTGAGAITISPACAEEMGIASDSGTRVAAKTANGTMDLRLVKLGAMEVAGIDLTGVRAVVLDLAPVIAPLATLKEPEASVVREEFSHIDGVLGRDFFTRADVRLDLSAGHVEVWPPGEAPTDGEAKVPITLHAGIVEARGRVGGTPVRAIVDLGANGGSASRSLRDEGQPTNHRGSAWGAEGEPVIVEEYRFPAVSLGAAKLGALDLQVCPEGSGGVACPVGRSVLVGFDALAGRTIVVSYARHALWIGGPR
jgi:clan AA aspartic protease (TIGR02281 family)